MSRVSRSTQQIAITMGCCKTYIKADVTTVPHKTFKNHKTLYKNLLSVLSLNGIITKKDLIDVQFRA